MSRDDKSMPSSIAPVQVKNELRGVPIAHPVNQEARLVPFLGLRGLWAQGRVGTSFQLL